jgi:amino acid permease
LGGVTRAVLGHLLLRGHHVLLLLLFLFVVLVLPAPDRPISCLLFVVVLFPYSWIRSRLQVRCRHTLLAITLRLGFLLHLHHSPGAFQREQRAERYFSTPP